MLVEVHRPSGRRSAALTVTAGCPIECSASRRRPAAPFFRLGAAALSIALALCLLTPAPSAASGFAFFAHGAKAAGMAGAFIAQADDPTAIYYNIGGLALEERRNAADQQVKERKLTLGTSYFSLNESLYQGLPPGPGEGTTGEQRDLSEIVPQIYAVIPVSPRLKAGVAIHTPFLLETEWADPANFAGRRVANSAQILTYDLDAALSFQWSPQLGVGLGLVYRTAEFSSSYRLPGENPFTGTLVDIADVAVNQENTAGLGFYAGVLHKPGPRFSWGATYHSAIEIDFDGVGTLTQVSTGNQALDDLFAATLPFDMDLATENSVEFPAIARFGVAVNLTGHWLMEVDATWTGWSSIQSFDLHFPTEPLLHQTVRQDFDDTLTLHVGAQFTTRTSTQFRFGVALDESPQLESSTGPFFTDFDDTIVSVGFGRDWLDVAFLWFNRDQRLVLDQVDGLNGNYRSNAWMLSLSASF